MKYIAFIAVLSFLVSCKKEAPVDNVSIPENDARAYIRPQRSENKDLETYTENFIKRRKAITLQLEALSAEEANALYDAYVTESSQKIAEIEKDHEDFVSSYFNYLYEGDVKANPPDSIQYKTKLLDKAGLEVWDIGEGMSELRAKPDYYLTIFKDYVTVDYREYITLMAEDNKVLFDNDAAIAIPLEDVAKRVINWENFIAKYPGSKKIEDAKNTYQFYQMAYLFGADNTPVMDYTTAKIYPENLEDFKNFCNKYPESPTTTLVHLLINNNGYYDELYKTVLKKQKNMGFNTSLYERTQ